MEILFTRHAKQRIEKRKLLKEEVEDAIKYPDATVKKHGLYYYQKRLQRGSIEVCCERTERHINVVTIYWL